MLAINRPVYEVGSTQTYCEGTVLGVTPNNMLRISFKAPRMPTSLIEGCEECGAAGVFAQDGLTGEMSCNRCRYSYGFVTWEKTLPRKKVSNF